MAYRLTRTASGPPQVTFDTPMDFVAYVADVQAGKHPGLEADPGSIRQADEIRKNPKGWEMSGGHPRKKDDWLARNLPWLGPAAIGGVIAAPYIGGLFAGSGGGTSAGAGAGASGASSALPTSAGYTNLGIQAGMGATGYAGPTAAAEIAGVDSAIGKIGAGKGVGSILPKVGNAVLNQLTSREGLGSLAALIPALMMGRGSGGDSGADMDLVRRAYEDAQRTNELRETRYRRVDPLHEAVTQLAFRRLPSNATEGIEFERLPLPPR